MTPEHDHSFREAQEDLERREPPRDEEEAASFKGMGHAITVIRGRHRLSREEVARTAEMTVAELVLIERGEINARWGDLRRIAKGLEVPFPELLTKAEEQASGSGGEAWRKRFGEAESGSTAPAARDEAAEGQKPS